MQWNWRASRTDWRSWNLLSGISQTQKRMSQVFSYVPVTWRNTSRSTADKYRTSHGASFWRMVKKIEIGQQAKYSHLFSGERRQGRVQHLFQGFAWKRWLLGSWAYITTSAVPVKSASRGLKELKDQEKCGQLRPSQPAVDWWNSKNVTQGLSAPPSGEPEILLRSQWSEKPSGSCSSSCHRQMAGSAYVWTVVSHWSPLSRVGERGCWWGSRDMLVIPYSP